MFNLKKSKVNRQTMLSIHLAYKKRMDLRVILIETKFSNYLLRRTKVSFQKQFSTAQPNLKFFVFKDMDTNSHQLVESGYLVNERGRGARSNLTKTEHSYDLNNLSKETHIYYQEIKIG